MKPTLEEYLLKQASGSGFAVGTGTKRVIHEKFKGINKDVWAYWMPQWAKNAAENYPTIKSKAGVRILSDSAKGIPAIVVGIGPSLDDQIEWIGRAERNAIIISADAALRALQAGGVSPHLVLQLDCRPQNASMFESVDTRGHVLVTNSCAHPDQLRAWKGHHLFYNMIQYEAEFTSQVLPVLFPHFGGIESKATVGNMAVLLAHFMGCDPIICAGMDLCFQPDPGNPSAYRYRATDYVRAPADEKAGLPERWVKHENKIIYDNDQRLAGTFEVEEKGSKYRVDEALAYYKKALIDFVGPSGIHMVNCAERGILRDLVETMPIEKALEKYCMPAFQDGQTIVPFLRHIIPALEGSHA